MLQFRVFHLAGQQTDEHFVVAFVQNTTPVVTLPSHRKFLQRTIEIQQQMEALRQSKAQIASEDYNPGRLDMEAIEAALCEAVEMHDGLVSEDFIDLFVSQVTPLSDSRFAWCLDFSPQPTVAFLNLAGQRKYTTCSMDSKLHFGPFADEEGHTIPFPGSLRR